MNFVTYLRVSTNKQGNSGLGLEAQRASVQAYIKNQGTVIAEFVEVESGKRCDRPKLEQALATAKQSGSILLIAKLDRLARNFAFIANLLDSGVKITAADMPEANRFVLHIMAAVAEQEGKAISERTKAALKAAKARGARLGWSNPKRHADQLPAALLGAATMKSRADEHAKHHLPLIEQLRQKNYSLTAIANELNDRHVPTARGGKWYATTVRNVIGRKNVIEKLPI